MGDDRASKVAAYQPRQIVPVLNQHRLVEAVFLAQLLVPDRIDPTLARHRLDRIARDETDKYEYDERDPDEGRNHETDARENEPEHDVAHLEERAEEGARRLSRSLLF